MTTDGIHGAVGPVARLVDQFHKLPGIGPKTAQRLTYYLVRMPEEQARELADALISVKERIVLCSECFNITEVDPCAICTNPQRDRTTICVVEEALDVVSLEKTGSYGGLYHVLHGSISPMNGIGPDELKIHPLIEPRRGRGPGGHPGHQPQPGRRDYLDVHPPSAGSPRRHGLPGPRAACPWAETSNTLTK